MYTSTAYMPSTTIVQGTPTRVISSPVRMIGSNLASTYTTVPTHAYAPVYSGPVYA
jgi:hypothetical protein